MKCKYLTIGLVSVLYLASFATFSTKYTQESKVLLKQLREEIKGTLLAVADNESKAGKDMTNFNYSLSIPATQHINLGLMLDLDNSNSGYSVVSVAPGSVAEALGIKSKDTILEINGIKISRLSSDAVLNRLQNLVPNETLTLGIKSAGTYKKVATELTELNVPSAKLNIGTVVSMANEKGDEILPDMNVEPSNNNQCGRASVVYSTPEARDIFPVTFKKVNNAYVKKKRQGFKLSVGKHVIYINEQIDSGINFNTRRSNTVKPIEIDVKANTVYHLGAKFNRKKRFRTLSGDYWEPVIWKTTKKVCNF